MVSVLLSRIRQARRVDGSGGDGGRDCYFTDADGTDAYELKSFTGRMGRTQRRQVERSLTRAMNDSPRSWALVVPIDPTPAEEQWFAGLQAGHKSTRLEWLGKTWLDDHLAQFPDIPRYFFGAAEEVIRILAEIGQEDALPGDAAQLAAKIAGRAARLNEINPYYSFDFSVLGSTTTVTVRPRYPDAFQDRPITMTAILQFDDSPAQQEASAAFKEFLRYGTAVTIPPEAITSLIVDAPAGLGGEFQGGTLILDGTFQPGADAAAAVLLRVPVHPPVRRMLQMDVTERSSGDGGLRLLTRDHSGFLTLELRFDFTQQACHATLACRHQEGVLPKDAIPVLRFCAELAAGEEMAVTDPAGNIIVAGSGFFGTGPWPEAYIQCAELMAEVQALSGTAFPLPAAFSPQDQDDLAYARAILRGEVIHGEWTDFTASLPAAAVDGMLKQAGPQGSQFMLAFAATQTITVAGGQVPLGGVLQIAPAARIINLDEVRAWRQGSADGTTAVQLGPGDTRELTMQAAPPAALNPFPPGQEPQ
jgi:hypothetical protein